jgi:regulator of sigma E protease
MTTALITVVSFLITVGVLVVVHEYGHYLAARWAGVKILRFSVGFGRPLLVRRRGRDQTEWVIASIPLGGYVKMVDEREGDVAREDLPRAFNRQNVWIRIGIVVAGPLANFFLAFVVYWALFIAGMPGLKPVLGDPPPATAASYAGLANGDTVTAIADEPVATFNDVRWLLLKEAVKRGTTDIEVQTAGGGSATRRLDMSGLSKDDLDKDFLGKLGMRNFRPRAPAVLGRLIPKDPAERAGMAEGDRVISINGKPVSTWYEFTAEVAANPGKPLAFELERAGSRFELRATPASRGDGENPIGRLGVEAPPELKREFDRMTTVVRYDPIAAIPKAAHKVWDLSVFSIKMLGRMIVGDISWKNLSGPITIADYAGQSAQAGWVTWLGFLALVSVSLGVLNLLPIPLLDGGHLVYYLAEIVKGSAVSDRTMEIGQRLGLALLLALTFFAFYNDINRLFTG